MKGKNVRNPIDVRIELDRKALRWDILMVFTHLVILAVISCITAYLFYKAGFPTPGLIVGALLWGSLHYLNLWINGEWWERSVWRQRHNIRRRRSY